MDDILKFIYYLVSIIFFLCYTYQFIYLVIPFIKKEKPHKEVKMHRYAVLVSARNEEAVITHLVNCIKSQDYPSDLITTFVVADNCTDKTADKARAAGAVVYERNDTSLIGKGYALDFLLQNINRDFGEKTFDGFFVFDADNLLEPDFITEMNKTFSDGYKIITSYRNSKNYDTNWISAGYALWFLREAKFLNNSRMLLNTSCAVSGTGFLFARSIIEKTGGWKFFLLTEDIEFSIYNVLNGEKIGYCKDAILYDEQPVKFSQSWKQRLRWSKGFLQVFAKYGARLFKGIFSKNWLSCFDMTMTIVPAMTVVVFAIFIYTGIAIFEYNNTGNVLTAFSYMTKTLINTYATLLFFAIMTTITEWKHIHTTTPKKIFYIFTLPFFVLTYIPISIVAIFKKVEWTPITHTDSKTFDEMTAIKES